MVRWPWEGMQCNHLVKYNGTSVEISGLSFQGFQLGRLAIEPKLIQAVSHALMLLDSSQYYFCQAVKNAPDEDSKKKYYDLMMEDKVRAQNIYMTLAALTVSPESKQLEEALVKMLLQNHGRALQIEQNGKVHAPMEEVKADSQSVIKISGAPFQDEINQVEEIHKDLSKAETQPTQVDRMVLFVLLTKKFNLEEIKTLCFKLGIEYENLGGDGKEAKARNLIQYVERRDKLRTFYDSVTEELSKRE